MKREIKFRGKTVDSKKYVYGNYVVDSLGYQIVSKDGSCFNVIAETVSKYVGIQDKHSVDIYEMAEFTFEFMPELRGAVKLKGYFVWCEAYLRYEINIVDSNEYYTLPYQSNGVMSNFELTGNIHEPIKK